MNCGYEHQIDDAIDGTLPPADAAAFEAHLPGCDSCSSFLADMRAIRTTADVLERHAPPPAVWTRIEQQIRQERRSASTTASGWSWRRLPASQLLSAAAVLVVLISGAVWLALRLVTDAPVDQATTVQPGERTPDPALIQNVETQLNLAEEHYSNAIAGLEAIASADQGALDPQTAEVLQTNLTVIDAAIGESRAALLAEPASELAQQSLFSALQSKVTLLQDTIALINEMRKGNEEGAARIVSEMNP